MTHEIGTDAGAAGLVGDYDEICQVVQLCIEGESKGDAAKLNEAFHGDARMFGSLAGTRYGVPISALAGVAARTRKLWELDVCARRLGCLGESGKGADDRSDLISLSPARLPHLEPGHAPKITDIIRENGRAVRESGRANQKVTRTDQLAGDGKMRQEPGMDPSGSEIKGKNWQRRQNRFDECFSPFAASGRIRSVDTGQ